MGVINGVLNAAGGSVSFWGGGLTNDVFGLDADEGTWEPRSSIPTARAATSAAVLDNKLYVVGGNARQMSPQGDVAVYPPDGIANLAPIASAGPDRVALVDEPVVLDGSASFDPDGTIASYLWDFGDDHDSDARRCHQVPRIEDRRSRSAARNADRPDLVTVQCGGIPRQGKQRSGGQSAGCI